MARVTWAALFCLAFLLLPRAARASSDSLWAETERAALTADTAFALRRDDHSSLSASALLLATQYRMNALSISLDWGICALFSGPDQGEGDGAFRAGNPVLTLRYQNRIGPFNWRFGLGAAFPLAKVEVGPDGRVQRAAYNHAAAMYGLWNFWLWAPRRISFSAPLELGWIVDDRWVIEVQAAAAGLFVTGKEQGDAKVFFQLAGEAGYRIKSFTFGNRLQAVIMPAVTADRAQFSWTPSFRLNLSDLFALLAATINLDGPLGGSYGIDPWAIHIGVGGQL